MLKPGDCVKVKPNIMDPDTGKYNLGGWQGRVTEIHEEAEEEKIITIQWDSQTLQSIPKNFIRECMEDGFAYEEMNLGESELELTDPRDYVPDRKEVMQAIDDENAWFELGEQGQRIKHVVDACKDDFAMMDYWFEHLENNLEFPIRVKYIGDSNQSLRQGAEIILNGLADADDFYGVIGSGRYDRRSVQVLLCDVQILEGKKTEALEDYIVWFANQ